MGGYNYQKANWVFGIEVDWSWGELNGSSPNTANFGCAGLCTTEVKSIGTVRGRVGYAFDRLLAYVTAGAAFTDYHASIGSPVLASANTTKTGFAGGVGVEYVFAQHWSAKVEYLYISPLDNLGYASCGTAPDNCFAKTEHIDMVRLGVNYRF